MNRKSIGWRRQKFCAYSPRRLFSPRTAPAPLLNENWTRAAPVDALMASFDSDRPERHRESPARGLFQYRIGEATGGFEPPIAVLQLAHRHADSCWAALFTVLVNSTAKAFDL